MVRLPARRAVMNWIAADTHAAHWFLENDSRLSVTAGHKRSTKASVYSYRASAWSRSSTSSRKAGSIQRSCPAFSPSSTILRPRHVPGAASTSASCSLWRIFRVHRFPTSAGPHHRCDSVALSRPLGIDLRSPKIPRKRYQDNLVTGPYGELSGLSVVPSAERRDGRE